MEICDGAWSDGIMVSCITTVELDLDSWASGFREPILLLLGVSSSLVNCQI